MPAIHPYHPSQHRPNPLPPVPLAVLLPPARTRHVPPPAATDPAGLAPATAARLIGIYTRPGDLVVDLGGTGTFATAAARAGRRTTTIVTDRHTANLVQTAVEGTLTPTRRGLARVVAAPLTDVPTLLSAASGRVQLLLTRVPLPGRRYGLRGISRWIAACATALAPGGHLLAAVDPLDRAGRYTDRATTVIVAARAAGLTYHQHLITITRPLPDPDQPPPPVPGGACHERIHTDLYAFSAGGGEQRG
jgi:hypothetical protein